MRRSMQAGNRRWRQVQYLLFALSMSASAFLYFAFLHPATVQRGQGAIVAKYRVEAQGEGLPAHYRLEIRLEGGKRLTQGLDTLSARLFEPGQEVNVVYEERGIPMIWKRTLVRELHPR